MRPPLTFAAWLRYDALVQFWPEPGLAGPGARVLEVGCGQGALGARLAARYDYLGLEPDPASAAVAQARMLRSGRGEVRQADAGSLGPAEQFDVICAFEVIEHLADDRAAVAQWIGHLRPGGVLLLSTPADPARFGPADAAAGHYRRYHPEVLAALLTGLGLGAVRVTRYGGPLGYALEAGRNALAGRAVARAESSLAERTAGSGRWHQPPAVLGLGTQAATLPFRLLQRRLPNRGVGLLASARRPLTPPRPG